MSTLLNLSTPRKENQISNHPWDRTIKGIFSNKIKHAHNSIKNPFYPTKEDKKPDGDCIKFTVIGDRVSKAFIYCVNLVKGLHKYRWKKFADPIIRDVSSVEWPEAWHKLKMEHGGLAHCLQSRVAVLINDNFLGGEIELKELIETKYIYHLQLDYYNEAVSHFATYIRSSGRPCAYMHISIDEEPVGTMIFMLYSNILPYTCDNFLRRCNDTKGGYSGTPVHRIVKDGWIQCGGFGLKSVEMDCENFIIPHDRRGVLCMANDGRHIDCSTQFFVLLQPSPWMSNRYVAFGQLIEGEATLDKIEKVPTWYESPTSEIIIFKAGIFNMECQDITINKKTNEYIHGHIEDLIALGDVLIEGLIQRVYLEIEMKHLQRIEKELSGEAEESDEAGEEGGNIHATKRFRRKKEDIEKQIQQNQRAATQLKQVKRQSLKIPESHTVAPVSEHENNDFDVDEYQLEESSPYQHMSIVSTSLVVKPEKHFFIPLTDVPFPGEVESTYDLKKFLKGDYCLESDLDKEAHKKAAPPKEYPPEIFEVNYQLSESESLQSLDSVDEREIRHYLRQNVDHVSFAGEIVRGIANGLGAYNLLDDDRKADFITDDQIRRIRMAAADIKHRERQDKKVSISLSVPYRTRSKIRRRQTGFVRPEELEKIRHFSESLNQNDNDDDEGDDYDDDTQRKVRIAAAQKSSSRPCHRPTGFVRMMNMDKSDTDLSPPAHDHGRNSQPRPSAMQRLYENVAYGDEYGPTLKDYKPLTEAQHRSMMLTFSPHSRIRNDESTYRLFQRHSINDEPSYENVLNLQHNNKRLARKISSDYVKTIDQMERRFENSIRSMEYAKARPAMSVSAYQLKNQKYQEDLKKKSQVNNVDQADNIIGTIKLFAKGIRLPGDTPLYSTISMEDKLTTREAKQPPNIHRV